MVQPPTNDDREELETAPPSRAERRKSAVQARSVARQDPVDACGTDSFPASDPPSWWSGG